jgi:hypothetical protein
VALPVRDGHISQASSQLTPRTISPAATGLASMPRRAAAVTVPAVLAADEVAAETVPLAEDTVPSAVDTAGAAVPPAAVDFCVAVAEARSFMEPTAVRAR